MSASRIAVVGASGRMGHELRALIEESEDLKASLGVSRSGTTEGFERAARELDAKAAAEVDVVVDFSLPEATLAVASWCAAHGKPLVSGVTGIGEREREALRTASASVAVLWSPNMSLGIAVMARMIAEWSRLEGFDFQIEELHHKRKKDKPSGTALFLQEKLEAAVGPHQPLPVAIRGGGIFGVHRAWAMGEEETLALEHVAMNRRVFARGALAAARWIAKKPAKLYAMDDVLGR